nr:unnamed protein product [Spirometra erinaceieuropaei]
MVEILKIETTTIPITTTTILILLILPPPLPILLSILLLRRLLLQLLPVATLVVPRLAGNVLAQRLGSLPVVAAASAAAENASVENRWCKLRDTVQSTALAVLGRARRQHQDRRRLLKQRMREMQDARTARKADEIQRYADRNEWNSFFSAAKAVYGPPTEGTAPLVSTDGSTLLTEKTKILQR